MTPSALLDHFGVAVSALSGVLAARGKNLDLFGVIVLALVTALGGGTIRDLLAGVAPVSWLSSPELLSTIWITAILGFFACRRFEPPLPVFQLADALALCAFAVAGTRKGLLLGFAPTIAITLGVITGVAGGIIRDTLTGDVPVVFRKNTFFYATAAFFGGLVYCIAWKLLEDEQATWIAVGSSVVLRLGALRYRLSLPAFESGVVSGRN
ncbi:MAG: trimeric intracellular cation channel family protein [Luteolibacter sp.]|uniref:trimeric intracellular cation channel family protein n=1 Tax=Luteolibacter sp. TaxID=1962973 RepID=UPI003265A4B4